MAVGSAIRAITNNIPSNMSDKRILIWYRNDLRLHDHAPLHQGLKQGQVFPLYCFDPRDFGTTSFDFPKTGAYRAKFILESVADLKSQLRECGADLIVRCDRPEKVIPAFVKQFNIDAVYFYEEATSEEIQVEDAVEAALSTCSCTLESFWGATLHHVDDIPFDIEDVPDVFTHYRKGVEKAKTSVAATYDAPRRLPSLPEDLDVGTIPSIEDLGLTPPQKSDRAVLPFIGGERAGKERLETYIWERDRLKEYKETRNGMLGADYSSKFSPWLARGCLSPRYVYEQVRAYEAERVRNDSIYWLIFELMWRDYFRLICLKYDDLVFYPSGLQGLKIDWKQDWERFTLWKEGKTGYPLVDANMREIAATGFMSNRGRQNVASFLTKNLGIDWRMGAEWFESLLVDYDVCSNWGNWNYTAGIGNDARGFRYFNIPKQSKNYDPDGAYLKHWLPELEAVPEDKVHEPWKLSQAEQKEYGVILGVDYPKPVVDFMKSMKANEKIYKRASG